MPWEHRRILIVVKTYPNPSAKYQETVCVAGIDEDANWVRVYPVQFRRLLPEQQFRKYDWIDALVRPARSDPRPESYNIDQDSIRIVGRIEHTSWSTRRDWVLGRVAPSVEQLDRLRLDRGCSLGVIRPALQDFSTTATPTAAWTDEEQRKLQQTSAVLFPELASNQPRMLEKIPYDFRYTFTDAEPGCRGHSPLVHDWEAYRYAQRFLSHGLERVARKMRQRFFEWMLSERDLHFVMGTMRAYPQNWIVVGLFYPPAEEQFALDFGDDKPQDGRPK